MKTDGVFLMPLEPENPPETVWDKPMAAEDFEAAIVEIRRRLDTEEGDELRAFRAWFMRRYPTARDRIIYVDRKTKQALAFAADIHRYKASKP